MAIEIVYLSPISKLMLKCRKNKKKKEKLCQQILKQTHIRMRENANIYLSAKKSILKCLRL